MPVDPEVSLNDTTIEGSTNNNRNNTDYSNSINNNNNDRSINNIYRSNAHGCNCRVKTQCPLLGQCFIQNIIYKCTIVTEACNFIYI